MTVAKQVFNSLTEYIQVRQFLVLMSMMATLELNSHWLIYLFNTVGTVREIIRKGNGLEIICLISDDTNTLGLQVGICRGLT